LQLRIRRYGTVSVQDQDVGNGDPREIIDVIVVVLLYSRWRDFRADFTRELLIIAFPRLVIGAHLHTVLAGLRR
jgi:hypothetical protein